MAAYGPLIVLLHEAGHAAFARLGGYRVTSFGIGLGTPLLTVYLRRGLVFHVDRWLFAGGACTAIPAGPPTARRMWFHGGGLIVQALLALVLLALPETWLVRSMLWFNAAVAATNALPWRLGGQASDGWYLLDALTGGRRSGSVLGQRSAFARMAARERAVGSPVGRVYSETCLAWADVLAGEPERASGLFQDDPAETTMEPWVDALYQFVQAEWHRVQGRPLAALRVARDAQEALDPRGPEEATGLLSLAEARALIDLDSATQAQRALARVAGVGGAVGGQAAVVLLWAALDCGPEELELATWRVERRHTGSWLDPSDAALALWAAALALDEQGRRAAASGARGAAVHIARQALARAEPATRERLTSRLQPVVDHGQASVRIR